MRSQPLMHPSETSPISFISSPMTTSISNTRICILDALKDWNLKEPHTPRLPPVPARREPPCLSNILRCARVGYAKEKGYQRT